MTYSEIRDIVRDVIASENAYNDRDRERLEKKVRDLHDTVYQLAEHFNYRIVRDSGVRIEARYPEVAPGMNGPSFEVPFPTAVGGFGQSIGDR